MEMDREKKRRTIEKALLQGRCEENWILFIWFFLFIHNARSKEADHVSPAKDVDAD
jgi:hypothetical protein